jgi:hypothetical protein
MLLHKIIKLYYTGSIRLADSLFEESSKAEVLKETRSREEKSSTYATKDNKASSSIHLSSKFNSF